MKILKNVLLENYWKKQGSKHYQSNFMMLKVIQQEILEGITLALYF